MTLARNLANFDTSFDTTMATVPTLAFNTIYPVGSIYVSTSSTFDPEVTFGGAWDTYGQGRVLVGVDSGITITTASAIGTEVTLVTASAHTLSVGDTVTVTDLTYTGTDPNGTGITVTSVDSSTELTYAYTGDTETFGASSGSKVQDESFSSLATMGGSKDHSLVRDEIPEHNHKWLGRAVVSGANAQDFIDLIDLGGTTDGYSYDSSGNTEALTGGYISTSHYTGDARNLSNLSAPTHDALPLLQPFLTVHMWKRLTLAT